VTLVHWFRRDLRIADNTALLAAASEARRLLTVFVLDDHYRDCGTVGPARFQFLRDSLEELGESLRGLGGRLIVRRGPPAAALSLLLRETGASAVYANREIGPYPERRDREVAAALAAMGASLRLFHDELLVEPEELRTSTGGPYTVYTPYARRWTAQPKRAPQQTPAALRASLRPTELRSVPLARVEAWRELAPMPALARGGELVAAKLARDFLSGPVGRYHEGRDRPDIDGTSRLSPHLHFGTISARQVRALAAAAWRLAAAGERQGVEKFLGELAWRDFYHSILFHFPRVADGNFREQFDRVRWQDAPELLLAWQQGRTGYPLVDAGMRQLATTHWMHNRVRMVVASFLTKDLHVDWRAGERWFEHELVDANLANNNGGWQWVAGTGTDAAPYFRILNPVLQSRRFDPQGEYIRRFVPELARVPAARIHEPWKMTVAEQRHAGCVLGVDYPRRLVLHEVARVEALVRYADIKG
jgi:deoxyribodipyrimidine photo-lyase